MRGKRRKSKREKKKLNKRKGRRGDDKGRNGKYIGEKEVGGGGGGEDEDYRERREVRQTSRGGRGKRDYTKHQQQPLKFSCLSSLCLCFLHDCLELFAGQCACKLLHGGNFSGCHLLQEGVNLGEKGGSHLCGKGGEKTEESKEASYDTVQWEFHLV